MRLEILEEAKIRLLKESQSNGIKQLESRILKHRESNSTSNVDLIIVEAYSRKAAI